MERLARQGGGCINTNGLTDIDSELKEELVVDVSMRVLVLLTKREM